MAMPTMQMLIAISIWAFGRTHSAPTMLALIAVSAWTFRWAYTTLRGGRLLRSMGPGALSPAFVSRYVSCLHAGALVCLALMWEGGLAEIEWWGPLARAVPVGYLIHDAHLIWTEPSLWEASTMAHHGSFALLVFFAAGYFPDHTARAFLAELSVFPLNLGWVMIKTRTDTLWPKLFIANSVVLLLTFLVLRVYTFTAFTLEAVSLKIWVLLPMIAGLAGLNWYWFALLVQKAYMVIARG